MTPRWPLIARALAGTLLSAHCTDTPQALNANTANVSAADAAVETPRATPPCDWPEIACTGIHIWEPEVLLFVRTIAPEARIIAFGGQAFGVETAPDAPHLVVRISNSDPSFLSNHRIFKLPSPDLEIIDVVDTFVGTPAIVLALACSKLTATCSLWQTSVEADDGSTMVEIPLSLLTERPRGLAFDSVFQRPCIFGKGVQCFSDKWETVIPADEDGSEIRDVQAHVRGSLAVGERGHYWTRGPLQNDRIGPWKAYQVDTDITLVAAAVGWQPDTMAAIGDNGTLMTLSPAGVYLCKSRDALGAVFGSTHVTTTGDVRHTELSGARCYMQHALAPDIWGGTTSTCSDAVNEWMITPHTVIGQRLCFTAL
jgi:hypothetical protein